MVVFQSLLTWRRDSLGGSLESWVPPSHPSPDSSIADSVLPIGELPCLSDSEL